MGTLYIVSTPIGNLRDITLRALEVLKEVDVIVCEDSRVSGKLLKEYEIEKQMIAVNDYNETNKTQELVNLLLGGKNVAFISDAGTPLVSDPGYRVVRAAIEAGIKVESIPGPSAVVSALVVSGKPPDKFMFVGFLPKKDGKRKELLENLKSVQELVKSTLIFYESPFRVVDTLEAIKEIFGDVDVAICRELTKLHEEVRKEKVSESIEYFKKTNPMGEFVVLV